ncbi:MAG TPA: ABC transporter ATP-binding protein [Jatrophihabitans sp.]|nr:ABC transporter ATP-binding protein [Jatrophihabitans sp.]
MSAVHDVSFDVNAGEVVLIMGPSGSGKTTLLLMLGALQRPTSGRILIDGADLSTGREAALPPLRAKHFGFVFQDFNLLSALSVVENVELACNLAGVTGRPARDRATRLLIRLDMTDRLTFHPEQLSGGEKHRVALARALANDPPVILADEPTANLDSGNGRDIARLLRELATRGPTKRHHRLARPAAQRHRRPHPLARRRPLPRTRSHGNRSGLPHARRDGRQPAARLRRTHLVVLFGALPGQVRARPAAVRRNIGIRPGTVLAVAAHSCRRCSRDSETSGTPPPLAAGRCGGLVRGPGRRRRGTNGRGPVRRGGRLR